MDDHYIWGRFAENPDLVHAAKEYEDKSDPTLPQNLPTQSLTSSTRPARRPASVCLIQEGNQQTTSQEAWRGEKPTPTPRRAPINSTSTSLPQFARRNISAQSTNPTIQPRLQDRFSEREQTESPAIANITMAVQQIPTFSGTDPDTVDAKTL